MTSFLILTWPSLQVVCQILPKTTRSSSSICKLATANLFQLRFLHRASWLHSFWGFRGNKYWSVMLRGSWFWWWHRCIELFGRRFKEELRSCPITLGLVRCFRGWYECWCSQVHTLEAVVGSLLERLLGLWLAQRQAFREIGCNLFTENCLLWRLLLILRIKFTSWQMRLILLNHFWII